jgi:hypothetical protein
VPIYLKMWNCARTLISKCQIFFSI